LLNARQNSMDQDHAAIFFDALSLFIQETTQGKSPPFGRPDHGRHFDEEPLSTEMAFQISRPGLRLRQERHAGSDTNQLGREFQFGQGRFLHARVAMVQPMEQPPQTEMARAIRTMPVQRRPTVFNLRREAFWFT
jgi:hypothetical protein